MKMKSPSFNIKAVGSTAAWSCAAWFYAAAKAQDMSLPEAVKSEFKFTPTHLQASDKNHALDLNLRMGNWPHTGWVGAYGDRQGYRQMRVGYEYRVELKGARMTWSPQFAQGGYLSASVSAEIGGDTFAIIGIDRNNLKDYYNLSFDPGNATVLGLGSRAIDKTDLLLFQVRDYRLNNHQQVTHAVMRWRLAAKERVTVDVSYKSGLGSAGNPVRGTGIAIGYDYGDYFVKLIHDPQVNFSSMNQIRFALGSRF